MKKLIFESTPCHRCFGSGNVGYGPYGGVCFKCNGQGANLTKRGLAAERFFQDSASEMIKDLKVGQWFKTVGVTEGGSTTFTHFVRIIAISEYDRTHALNGEIKSTRMVVIEARAKKGSICRYETTDSAMVRVAQTSERRHRLIDLALAFQASLTKSGTVRKRAAK